MSSRTFIHGSFFSFTSWSTDVLFPVQGSVQDVTVSGCPNSLLPFHLGLFDQNPYLGERNAF